MFRKLCSLLIGTVLIGNCTSSELEVLSPQSKTLKTITNETFAKLDPTSQNHLLESFGKIFSDQKMLQIIFNKIAKGEIALDIRQLQSNIALLQKQLLSQQEKEDAYFAINGVKVQLKEMMEQNTNEGLDAVITTLKDVKRLGHNDVSGYKYCLSILCLHFNDQMDASRKSMLFSQDKINNIQRYGNELMRKAAEPTENGGDDDCDAANYLEYNK